MKIFSKFLFLIIFSPLFSSEIERQNFSWLEIIPKDVFRLICIELSKDEAVSFISLSVCSQNLYDRCLEDENLTEAIYKNITPFDFPVLKDATISQQLIVLSIYNGKIKYNVYMEDKDFPNHRIIKYDGFVLSENGQVYRRDINGEYLLLKGDLENRLITAISPSKYLNNLALDKDGKVYQWFGQKDPVLVKGLEDEQMIFIHTINDNNFALTKNGEIYVWGKNRFFELGLGHNNEVYEPTLVKGLLTLKKVTMLKVTINRVLALSDEGEVYTWGTNNSFQLGLGHNQDVNEPALLKGELKKKRVISIEANYFFSVALTSDGKLYVWGGVIPSYFPLNSREPIHMHGEVLENRKVVFIISSDHTCFFLTDDGLLGFFPLTSLNTTGYIKSLWDIFNIYVSEKNEKKIFAIIKITPNKFYGRLKNGVEYLWQDDSKDSEVFNNIRVSYPTRLTPYWYEKIWQALKEKYFNA